jgi:hypothetical protein
MITRPILAIKLVPAISAIRVVEPGPAFTMRAVAEIRTRRGTIGEFEWFHPQTATPATQLPTRAMGGRRRTCRAVAERRRLRGRQRGDIADGCASLAPTTGILR